MHERAIIEIDRPREREFSVAYHRLGMYESVAVEIYLHARLFKQRTIKFGHYIYRLFIGLLRDYKPYVHAAPRGVCEGVSYIGIRHEIRASEIYILSRPVNGVQKSRFGYVFGGYRSGRVAERHTITVA